MMQLEETHPEAYMEIQRGEFAIQRSSWNDFDQVAVDHAIEKTVNCDTKCNGGIIGFSLQKGAVQRWLLKSHEWAAMTQACRTMAGVSYEGEAVHKELGKARLAQDEADVRKVCEVLRHWINPFAPSDELTHLASGTSATADVAEDLLTAHAEGKMALEVFVENRLITPEVPFQEPLKKQNLKTFSSGGTASTVKVAGRDVMLKADRDLFARLLVAAQA